MILFEDLGHFTYQNMQKVIYQINCITDFLSAYIHIAPDEDMKRIWYSGLHETHYFSVIFWVRWIILDLTQNLDLTRE